MDTLCLVSFNLHGFNQVEDALVDIVDSLHPSFLLLQEHWLVADNLFTLDYLKDNLSCGEPCNAPSGRIRPSQWKTVWRPSNVN